LGDGTVALVLDVAMLIHSVEQEESQFTKGGGHLYA
jgi:chemotaxis protein histidine kinase CheA